MNRLVSCLAILLLTLGASLALRAAERPATRVVRVKAVADEAFREKKNWEKEIREHLKWSDKEFRKMVGIGLELAAIDGWTTHESQSISLLLKELRLKADKGEADIMVGFTGHEPPEISGWYGRQHFTIRLPHLAGMAMPLGDRCVVRRGPSKKETRHTLLHEIAHLFGGLHVKKKSLLQTFTDATHFRLDPFNQRVFELTRERDFNQDIHELSQGQINQLVALYGERPPRHERDFDTPIRVAYLQLAVGEVDSAIDKLLEAIEIDPSEARSIVRHVILPELETYAEEHGATTRVRYMLGRAYNTVREWDKSAKHLSPNCFGLEPHARSCSTLGASLLEGQAYREAQEVLQRALELDDSLGDAHNNLGILYAATGRTSEALAHLNRAAELDPDDPGLHFNRGMTYLQVELQKEAEEAFRRVLDLKPEHKAAHSKLALVRARQGDSKRARKMIRDFEKQDRLPVTIIRDMAEIYFLDGDSKRAWKYLDFAKKGGLDVADLEQQMRASTPKRRKIKTADLLEQAEAYYDQDNYDQARQLLEQARAQDPKKEEVHYWLGLVAHAQDKPDEAAQHLQHALQLKEKFADAHLMLGVMVYDRQDYAAARGHLSRYLELEEYPVSSAYYLLGASQLQLDDLAAAEHNLKKAIQRRSDYGDAFYRLATVYSRTNRKPEAIAELKLALETTSLDASLRPEAHYDLAALCYESGQHELARKHARIAQRLGHADAGPLLAKLAPEFPGEELAEADEMPSGVPAEPRLRLRHDPAPAEQHYRISDAVLGDPPGILRAGEFLRGRLRLVRKPEAEGPIALSLTLTPPGSSIMQYMVYAFPEVADDEEEQEIAFNFMVPPSFLREGEFRGVLAVVTRPDLQSRTLPASLSNELRVTLRIVGQ